MSNGVVVTGAMTGAIAAAAAIAQAIKASGAIVRVESRDFAAILNKATNPLVICTQGGFFSTKYQYLTSYKGLVFYTKSKSQLRLPTGAEIVQSKKIWIPG